MQRYEVADKDLYPFDGTDGAIEVYLTAEVDAAITQLADERDTALIAHSKLAMRVKELEQDNARWISARDVWAAEMKAKDERIKELEKALMQIAIDADGDGVSGLDGLTFGEIEHIALNALGKPIIQLQKSALSKEAVPSDAQSIPDGWCPICGANDGSHKPGCEDGSEIL